MLINGYKYTTRLFRDQTIDALIAEKANYRVMPTRDIGLKNVGLIDLALSFGIPDALEFMDYETRGSL